MAKHWTTIDQLADPSHPMAMEAIASASWILYKLTAEKYPGVLETTDCYSARDLSVQVAPVLVQGRMMNLPVASTRGNRRELYLRHSPVHQILELTLNGESQDLAKYQLRNHSFIIRKDRQFWSLNSALEVCVTYRYGTPPPRAGVVAATRLADELLLAYDDSDQCAIPTNVSSVERQGVNFQMYDPQTFISEGRTGIREVDFFIAAANPGKARKRARLYSPTRITGETIQ